MDYAWHTVTLISKGDRGFCGIGIVEVIWKAVLGVVRYWIGEAIYCHNTLHGFRAGRVTGTTPLIVKLLQ